MPESKDGTGSGDRNVPFVFGNPRGCLTTMQLARLTIMRGWVMDARRGLKGVPFDGDSDYVIPTPSGLFVPADHDQNWGEDE